MPTIPASELVSVNPSVLAASGSTLDTIGLMLSTSTRVPVGTVLGFPDAPSVGDYFGLSSVEASLARNYFSGFDGSSKLPGSLLMTQYNPSAVSAYVRGGDVSDLTLANLQALAGVLTVVVDGKTSAASVNLSGATSFSAAAGIIETALNAGASVTGSVEPNSVTGTIAPNSFTASIAGTTMTVSAIGTGAVAPGQTVSGVGVANGTKVDAQLTGTAGSTGTYQVSISQTVGSETMTTSGGTLNATAVLAGTLAVGQTLSGTGVTAGTKIAKLLTGTGGTGKYAVDISQTVSSTTITANGGTLTVTAVGSGILAVGDIIAGASITAGNTITQPLTGTGGTGTYLVSVGDIAGSGTITVAGAGVDASYDSVSGGFIIASSTTGPSSTMALPTTDAFTTALGLTQATGAVLSQGAAAASPAAFMDAVVSNNPNWVTFMTAFDPDNGSGNTAKQAFAAWKDGQNDRYAYVVVDSDVTPTESVPATGSLGYILANNGDSGTCLIYQPSGFDLAAFVCGATASIDFTERNGRITFAYKAQAGLPVTVDNAEDALNLAGNPQGASRGNGYNFYGAYASAPPPFIWFQRGFVTGDFAWFDSYINQIWLNNQLQFALLTLQKNSKSIPYSIAGDTLIEAALADPIAAGLNFGAFGPGTISAAQAVAVDSRAGAKVSDTLQTQGYFLQVLPASSATRAARTSPPCTFWYLDRGSVQAINLNSIALQ